MNKASKFKTHRQVSAYSSPWSLRNRILILLWPYCWAVFCSWTPKPFNRWRLLWLQMFGARIFGRPFVHSATRIQMPWNLILNHRASLGDGAWLYSLGEIEICEDATIGPDAFLCTGTHQFNTPNRALQTAKICIGRSAFIGARAFVMPGVFVGEHAIVGACSVVTKNVASNSVVAGNPATAINSKCSELDAAI